VIEAGYEFPYLAHAAMEPLNCVMRLADDNTVEVWNGAQFQTGDQHAIARTLGIKPEQVKINMLYAGGSFGRRANPRADYLVECAEILVSLARAGRRNVPVKLVWTREDDMKAGFYRPAYYHSIRAALDANGKVAAWQQRIVGQSIVAGTMLESQLVKNGVDMTSVEGASTLPYAIPNLYVDLHSPSLPIPVLWWRSVGSTHTAYSTETFVDELAAAAKQDPVEFRRAMLDKHPRHRTTLDLAAKHAGWGTPLPAGKAGEKRARGVAVHESFGTVVAQVAEVTVRADNTFSVDRVVCAVDCGIAVNPDNVRAQMEGGIGFGLSAALHGAITIKDGAVEQSNFHDYPVLRINEMPRIDVHIVPSTADPSGVGEPGTPVIAPAVANALAAATGKRLRRLPLTLA
jgi:isoquinoline 1-oxidoreductase beta subunit